MNTGLATFISLLKMFLFTFKNVYRQHPEYENPTLTNGSDCSGSERKSTYGKDKLTPAKVAIDAFVRNILFSPQFAAWFSVEQSIKHQRISFRFSPDIATVLSAYEQILCLCSLLLWFWTTECSINLHTFVRTNKVFKLICTGKTGPKYSKYDSPVLIYGPNSHQQGVRGR